MIFKKIHPLVYMSLDVLINTPYGVFPSINADITASGIPYAPIEKFISQKVLPYYANTHSNAHNGQLMANYITQSKDLIRESIKAKPCDKVIFTGSGCSGAIVHLIHILNLRHKQRIKPVVFISVGEHHSNYLPWQHLPVKLVIIPFLESGTIDIETLKHKIQQFKDHPLIGCFIAGSNVTGILQPVNEISILMHNHGGLIFWDYAGCAPYVEINMHRDRCSNDYFDGIMMSPHKFLGGPGTPGILVANNETFKNKEPFCPSGGTVRFVCKKFTHYNDNLETRETGGTPNIIGCIKAGLVFQLKDSHLQEIIVKNSKINLKVRHFFSSPEILKLKISLVNMPVPVKSHKNQVPIYSFRIENLHYNFVVALLNDLFGIQSRGGVSCCSLYAQHLLKLNSKHREEIYQQIISDKGVAPDYGWCRVTFHYTMSEKTIDYILTAIKTVAIRGAELIKDYNYIPEKNNWNHKKWQIKFPKLSL